MIEIDSLCFKYPKGAEIIKGLSYVFDKGIYTISGRNGSGKTTLLRLIMGLIKPVSGKILIDGIAVSDYKRGDLGKKIGYISAEPMNQLFSNSVYDELAFPLKFSKISKDIIEETVENYIHKYNLEALINKNPLFLSDGEQKRVLLCAIDMQNSSYLVLDEPSASLDSDNKAKLIEYLKVFGKNKTVIAVSHDEDFIQRLNGKRLNLTDGVLI